ncbi:microtubule-actin cross-linking factor 1-like isoform X12 [Limulus polyphemus]|uniref:Microtubule-actin cross-linking factor 1-like isoform X12 n=1 Tax=Limulus polyphemus TaxID=6850 RepID=A0ABM1S7G0_LIMPO|nr:microtubule-actin cross-linking factor 1-like isoform X12 [Limulus polyphemus]
MRGSAETPFLKRDDMSIDQTRPAGLGKERASYIFKWWEGPQPVLVAALKWELVISALKAASITSIVLALGITLIGTYLFTSSGTARPVEPDCTLLQAPFAGRQFTCEAKNHCPLDWIPSLAAVVTLVDVFFAALFGGLLALSSSNMHSRRQLKGSRQQPEPDTLVQSSSSTSSQEFRSSFSSSEVRTSQTSRVIRKTTTMVQGGDQQTVTTNVVSPGRTITTQHMVKQESSSSVGRTDRTDKTRKVQGPIKSSTSRKVLATTTPGNKRITTKTVEKIEKKQKISDIIGQTDETISARDALLNWAQRMTDLYPGVTVIDFTSSWRDGLAFNAIIHRNRPDLIDWRSLRANSPHENLELAFSLVEREYGVTRLLDPEDVDTLEPDEKSLITYISSLYDVFPEPPAYHPFADNDKLRKLEEYKELASILHLWMRETIMMLQDRTFPNTLVEMKAFLAECNRFRVEDIPQKLHDKQKLSSLYRDIQKIFRETGSVEIESELEIDTIERNWNRLMVAHQDRDQAVHDEINRLEKLQRLAEKLHREAKQCDGKLDDIDKRIAEEEKRVQRLHPTDAIYICDQIEAELKLIEENIQTMFQDVGTLRDGRYHQTHELYKRVQNIQQRWLNIRLSFTSRLLTPLSSRTFKTEERQVTKQRQVVSERRLVETNDAFKFLQECLDWVNGKLKLLYAAEYGSDLPSVKSLLENHQLEHQSIDQFHVNIDQCGTRKHQFQGDEQELYYRLFSKLEKSYTELMVMSNKRLMDLETLLDFIQSATNELMWMNKKEETEVTRDWSSKTLDVVEIEQYQETLTSDLEKREIQFNAVTDRGQSLQLQKHPATECIEAYLAAMQSQWSWLLQLTICLEEHLKHSSAYHQFFMEARECEQWLGRIEDRLNTTFSRKTFPIDEGERLLMQMLELREDMMHYKNIVLSLVDRSKEIVPLKQRRQHLPKPLKVTAICSYKQLNMTVSINEHCWLHDNSQKIKWKVINSAGTEGMVPGVCFVIPPPNTEAIDLAQSLNKKFDNVLTLWFKKHHKLRQNMIFSTVRVIKSWDFTTFRSMEPAQRESIQRALKEDGQKLVDEGDTNDPDLKRLQEEINICNKLFQDFLKRLKGDEVDRTSGSRFTDLISSLQNSLNEKEKILQNRSQEPIPRDLDTLETQVMDHKGFETDLKSLEPQIEEMKDQFQSMAKKSPVLQNRHDTVIEIWERTWTLSHLYIERLKSVEIILTVLDEATNVVTQMEIQLVNYENLSADRTSLSKTHEQLMKLQGQIQQGQNVIDQLNNDLTNVQRLTECTRPKQVKHPDIKKLEDDVKKITKRWDNGCSQVVERLRSCEAASELIRTYRTKLDKDEQPWMNQMLTQVKKLKPVNSMTPQEAEKQVQDIVELYNSVSQRKSSIEHTNTLGGRYVREAKIYDLRLKHYRESLEEVHPSLDASIPKKAKVVVGADVISQELDVLNKQYSDLVDKILQYLNELREYLSGQKDYKCSITISRAVPITPRSFRSELIMDQASVQEPMDMDDRYYSVQEGYTTLTYTTQDKVIPEHGTETRKYFTTVTEPTTVSKRQETTRKPSEDLSSPQKRLAGTSMTIKEVRSTRRLEKTDQVPSFEYVTAVRGIANPKTGELLTMTEAIKLGILNINTGQYTDLRTDKRMNLQDAVSKGLIDGDFVNRITEVCGIIDVKTGIELTLIEAIQKGLFDPDKGTFIDPKQRIPITIDEAIHCGIVREDKVQTLIEMKIVKISKLTITEAVQKGLLDPQTGQFRDPKTHQLISLKEAFERGFLEVEVSAYSEGGIPLAEAIDRGMVNDKAGQIVDKDSGERFTIDEAINRGIIRRDVREVVNTQSEEILSVPQSLSQNVINAQSGRYINKATQECLTFQQAYDKQFILRPLTLKDAYELDLLDETGRVTNPVSKQKLTIIDAIAKGILNIEVKSIIHPDNEELLTLPEALEKGVLTPHGQFVDSKGELISLSQAVNKGLITSVCHKMIFDIEGIKNPVTGDNISFNNAVSKGFIDLKTGKFRDTTKGGIMTFDEATTRKFIQPQITEMMNKKIGVKDDKGKELTILEAVFKGLLDAKTGQVREPRTKKPLPLKEAIEKNIITPEGAAILKSLLNITVTLATVTKTITRYVTVTSQGVTSDVKITFQDAMRRGLIDETHGTFKEPNTGEIMPLEEAINRGILGLTSEWPTETPQEIPGYPTEPYTTGFHRTTITHRENISPLPEKELLPTVSKKSNIESYTKELPTSPKESSKKGPSAHQYPKKESPGKESPRNKKESPFKEPSPQGKKFPIKDISEPTNEDAKPKKPFSIITPDEYQPTEDKSYIFKQVLKHDTIDVKFPEDSLETQAPNEKPSVPAREEPRKARQPSPTKEEPGKGRQPSPTKEEPGKGRQPSPTKEEPGKGRQPSPTKVEPFKGRKPSEDEPFKSEEPSPLPSKEEPVRGRKPSPTREEPVRGKETLPVKEKPMTVAKSSPTRDEPIKDRKPSITKEEVFKSREPSPGKVQPVKERTPSPTKEEPTKEVKPWPSKSLPFEKDVKELTSPVKVEKPDDEPLDYTDKPEKQSWSVTIEEHQRETTSLIIEPQQRTYRPSSPSKEPAKRISFPSKEEPTEESTSSPTKEEPERKVKFPTRELEKRTPFSVKEETVKGRTPSLTKEEPKRKVSSPTKEPERMTPSPTEEVQLKEPERKVSSPVREVDRKTPSSTREPLTRKKSPSPTKEEPEVIASLAKEPEKMTPFSIKEQPLKGKTPSSTKQRPEEKLPLLTKEKPEEKVSSPVKEPEKKYPSRTKEPTTKGKTPPPPKDETEKDSYPVKEPERRYPSPSKETPLKGRTPSPTKDQPDRKYPLSSKDLDRKTPSPVKELPFNGRSPAKEEPEKKTRYFVKEPEVESPKSLSPKKTQTEQKPEISHIVYTNGTNGVEETTVTSFITKYIETFEVPPDGWFLKEAVDQKLFDTETGLFTIPGTDRLVSFEETIRLEIINPKSASVVEPSTKRTVSLLRSLEKGILDSTGHYVDSKTKGKISMKEAIKKKLIILEDRIDVVDVTQQKTTKVIHITQMDGQPDQVTMVTEGGFDKPVPTQWGLDILSDVRGFPKTAVEEKYKLSGDNILKLLRWIEEVEGRLADLDQVHENITELQKQIARARDIKDDLDDHQRPVATCLDKVRQIVQQGADVLSKEEIEQLQKDSNELKKRYDKVCEESEKLLRRLSSSQEELEKFNVELQTFKKWLIEAEHKLNEQEKNLGDVKNLKENSETFKVFMNDVIAHQADLRFITMIAQKFIDESKDYLKILNNFRTNLPRRRAHVEPKESEVKTEVSGVSTTYHNLLNRVNRLSEKFSGVIEKQRYYVECLEKATVWLQDVQKSSSKLLGEPIAAEPRAIQDQLNRIKTISLDIVGQSRLIENTKQSGKFFIEFLEGTEVSIIEIQVIEETLQTLEDDYYTLSNEISEKCNELQTALVQSQDIQDGLDRLLKWLDETENTFRTQNKAISLIRERLDEQIREHKVLQTDIDSQKPSISAVTDLAKDLTDSSNQRLAKKVESKVKDINTRFDKLCEKSRKRGELLDEVVAMVKTFEVMIVRFEEWIQVITETVESREIIQLSTEEYFYRIEEVMNQRTAKKEDFDEIVKTGKNLVSKRDVTDTTPTKDKVKSLEQQWKDLGDHLTEKQRAGKTRAQQQSAYETLRAKVLEWLGNIENRVEELDVVAIDQDVLQKQAAETKHLIKEHTDYAPTVDKVNDLGNSYDAILHGERGDSPRRRAGSPTKKVASSPSVAPSSPTKKSPPSEYTETRRSPDVQSPTQAKFIQSPLSTVSSGFSSQRSSADNLRGVEDLSPVQQQLSEINNRYSLLGVKLSDRHQEIETLTEEVKRHLETIRILLTFVKAKEKQLPQEALPENKEQAGKQLLLLKTIQEEVQEKQPDMDRVKTQAQDLLRKKPNVLGSDNLRNQINELVSCWTELIQVTKQQLDLLQGFKDFQDTHDIVTNWLTQKDKMLQVLGPIASEPRMVTSQMQQVQVMREEFRSQQPLLDRLDSSGQAIIDSLGPASPASTKVQDQMDTIHRTWDDLLRQLADREKSLDAACGVTKEFHDTLNRLQVCLQEIGDNFDQLSESSFDIVQQLNTLNDLEGQLESQRPHLAGAESVCEELCEILSDSTSKTEIKTKLITFQKQFINLTKKIDNRKAELESSQKEDQEFYLSCENIKIWLDKMQDCLSKTLNISADHDTLTEQVKDFQPLYRDVLDKEHEVHILLSKGSDVVNKITNKTEALQLKNKLDTIKIQWDSIRKDAHDRQNRLQRCADTSRRFHSALAEFIPWLEECEKKLDSLKPICFQRTELDKQVKDIQTFKNELSRHSQEFDNICSFGEVLLDQTDVDQQDVQQKLNELKERWDRLNQGVLERAQAMDNVSRLLITYHDTTRDVQHTLQRLEDKMTSFDGLSDVVLLDRLKVLLEEANDLYHQLDQVRDSADQLLSNAGPDSDIDHISEEVTTLENRHKHLIKTLENRCAQLEFATNVLLDFTNKEKKVQQDLRSLEEELDNMAPVARVITVVQTQIVEIKDYMGLLEKVNDDIEDVCQQGENVIRQGYATDVTACREKLHNLRQQFSRIEERAKVRYTILESSLAQLERFYEDYGDTMTELDKAIKEEKNFKIISGEVETIRSLQEEFKIFRRTHIEPLSKQITDVNKLGQGLVQSAMPGVDTTKLEQDMETLNEKWNSLKERLNDRERLLDLTLLQSGKFQEALEGVQKWLQDTEEMISNQKAPSADYKVVKAQLQEQKFLRKLLLDRQNSMTSLSDMGTEIMQNLEPTERKQITVQLNYLTERFNILITEARERMEVLEKTIPVAQDFQDKIGPLLVWLERVEKRLVIMTTIPIDQDKIHERITEHKELHEDIINHKILFDELNDVGETLVTLVSEEEAYTIREKFQDTNYRYVKVKEDSENIGRMLVQALEGMGTFLINCEKLLSWLQEVDNKLSRYQILSVYVDKLQEQIDELTVLRSEIESHHWEVESLITSAQEIMKHASGDDAVQVKDKADAIQSKFNEVSQRCNERQKQALEVLPLTQNFHSSHEQLVFWMDETERILKTLESLSLITQETTIAQLEKEIHEYRPLVESVSSLGPRLCQISPGEGSHLLETLVTRDNRRYDAICEQVQRKAERIQLSKQKNSEVMADIDELLEWFQGTQQQVQDAEPLYPDPDTLTGLVKEQKVVNEDVSGQKSRVRDILANAKKLMREMSTEDLSLIREKADELKDLSSCVSTMCIDRMSALEQALPLAQHFFETHADLIQWLDEAEAEAELLETPTLNVPQIKRQQDKTQELLQSLNEHKPLVDKLNKTGSALLKLCGDEEGSKIQEIMDSDNSRYNSLRGLIRNRQNKLEEALQATSQFSDKLDGMLQALSTTVDQLGSAEPISAHPERIVEQITDNKNVLEDLAKRSTALEAVKRAADDVITKAGKDQPAVEDIRQKLDRLNDLWDNIQKSTKNRGRSLEDALTVAEKFWDELNAVMKALKELQENLNAQDPPAIEPSAIQEQQEALQEIKQEIDQTRPEVDQCRQVGQDLMQLCGEPDKPEVKKHIEDLDSAWENVTTLYAKREQNLVDAMEKAMSFHFTLQNLLEFLDNAEEQFTNLGPVGSDIDAVKSQIGQLKDFKTEVDPHMIEIEALNRQAQELVERTSPDQALAIREPLAEINRRWDNLLRGIVERQQELENALLKLGQFQHALDELLSWITRTERTLTDLKPVAGDPQVIEVELAKHKVLVNDIQAHQSSIDTINRVGHQLVDTDHGSEDANVTQKKMNDLNIRWQQLQDKAIERQKELEAALKEAVAFNQEIQDLLLWLSDVDSQLATSKPVGGLPETAKEQLNRFMELYNELDSNRHKVETVLQQGQDYLKRTNEDTTTNLQHNLKMLKQRWDSVLNKANDRKIKLEIALREATQFHEALQEFVDWLTNAEKYLTSMKPVSRVMETVMEQIKDHKSFQKDLGSHREVMLNLDKKGTHLKYFSQKQDVILIKNLLISVQHRWERVVSKAAERTRMLDHGYKEAKEFYDAWSELISWLDEAKATLDSLTHIGKDPDKIKQLLNKHKEFQRALGAKQSKYDTTMKIGRILKDRCPKSDLPGLQEMIDELKNKWNAVCNKSVNRQRELEEALLYSGQFKDAVVALFDWLDRAKGILAIEQPIQGDLDTVTSLVDQHKTFQNELQNRANNLESVRRTAGGLLQTATPEEMQHIHSQVNQLDEKWEELIRLSNEKQQRLDEALQKAELLHKSVHILLEWLSDAEIKLRFTGPLPDDEETIRQQIIEHQHFLDQLKEQEDNKDKTLVLAQEILQHCHPDGITIIRHWITIIQSRWEEIYVWARQRDQKLQDHLRSLRDITDLLEELMKWLLGAEATLTTLEAEPLSDEVPVLEQLITDHQDFMADMTKRQPEIDQITKAFSNKRQPSKQSHHPPHRVKGGRHEDRRPSRGVGATGPKTSTPSKPYSDPEIKNPHARDLLDKWRNVWLLAMERQRRLQDKLNYLRELERIKNFNFDEWRRRFLGWMNNKKSRIMDLFRKIDKNNDGRVTRAEFINGILKSKFPTSRLEMERVAEIFDINGDGFIDNKEYIDTLRPDREGRPKTDAEKIQDEVQRQVAQCLCVHKFKVYQVGEGKYRFGESQKLRLVRILRSTVMVRVGGGWVALDEFLVKNDPCRAKGRTNVELREQFTLAEGVSQSMSPFRAKPSSNASQSSHSGSSFGRSGSIPSTGPITKVREKSERSTPLQKRRTSGTADTSSESGPSFSETDSFGARSGRPWLTPTAHRGTPSGTKTSSRPTSRNGSRPSSRPSSKPPSRAGSDLSTDSVEAYRSARRTPVGSTKIPASTGRQRTPSGSSQTSATKSASSTPGTRIPTARKTSSSSTGRADGIKGKERWK